MNITHTQLLRQKDLIELNRARPQRLKAGRNDKHANQDKTDLVQLVLESKCSFGFYPLYILHNLLLN